MGLFFQVKHAAGFSSKSLEAISGRTLGAAAVGLGLALSLNFAPAPAVANPATAANSATASTQAETRTLGQLAFYYRSFSRDMRALSTLGFETRAQVRDAAALLSSYDSATLSQGWFAHHALRIAQNPDFVSEVLQETQSLSTEEMIAKIERDKLYIITLSERGKTIGDLIQSVSQEVAEMEQTAQRLISRAYEFQGGNAPAHEMVDITNLKRVAFEITSEEVDIASARYDAWPCIGQILGLATRLSINAATSGTAPEEQKVAFNKEHNQCMRWAQLNMAQCMAAAANAAEQSYCSGKHGIREVSSCMNVIE